MNQAGIELLKDFEGWRSEAYQDIVGVWTIGYGFIDGVKEGQTMTRAQGEARLKRELAKYEKAVREACTRTPTENELAAMVCLAWNIGIAGFKRSTVLKAHNRGEKQAASRAFGMWNRAGGKEIAGLTRRRAAEAELYLRPEGDDPAEMPQRVDPEKPLSRSPMQLVSGTITGGSAVTGVATVAEVAGNVQTVREGFGDWLPYLLIAICILGVIGGGYLMWARRKQKSQGWA